MRALLLHAFLALLFSGCVSPPEEIANPPDCEGDAPAVESADCWPASREVSGAFD